MAFTKLSLYDWFHDKSAALWRIFGGINAHISIFTVVFIVHNYIRSGIFCCKTIYIFYLFDLFI